MKNFIALVSLLLFFLVLPVWLGIFLVPNKPGLNFEPTSFSNLTNWRDDNHAEALAAFHKSCAVILKRAADKPMPEADIAGMSGDWHGVCTAAQNIDVQNSSAATAFFETNFTPLSVTYDGEGTGTFTGYHEPLLKGSLTQSARYDVPLYKRPDTLIKIDLGAFRQKYKGVSLRGTLKGNQLIPFDNRTAIVDGSLKNQNLELLWVDSAVDAFFLHVQGSGRVELDDGRIVGIGYADKNGQPYLSIGRILIEAGEMTLKETSAQSIKQWLKDNPDRVRWLLDQNPSFIFFRALDNAEGPYGSAGVTLTAERSLAIDRAHLPLHAPVWVEASHPDQRDSNIHEVPMHKLMIAQDTGGAIKGAVRGDVFWGHGEKSDEIAGRMNNKGQLFLLLPHSLANKLSAR